MQENRRQLWAALVPALVSLILELTASRERPPPETPPPREGPPQTPRTGPVQQHRISPESVQKIRVGMTEWQVEALLGAPPGDYRTSGLRHRIAVWNPQGLLQETWESDELVLVVLF